MVEARITMSAIAVGPAADPELLGNIAKWGKGRYYAVSDAKELPQIFVKEAKNAAAPAFDEKAIKPVVKTPAFLPGVDLARMPPLKGRTATVLKDTALEVITTDEEDPLLAFWPVGLGRIAVFASDVKDRWAADWVTLARLRAVLQLRHPRGRAPTAPGRRARRRRLDRSAATLAIDRRRLEARDASGRTAICSDPRCKSATSADRRPKSRFGRYRPAATRRRSSPTPDSRLTFSCQRARCGDYVARGLPGPRRRIPVQTDG